MKLGLQNESSQIFRRKWVISALLLAALVVNTLLVLAKYQLLWAVRSTYVPPYTPPRALPFSNVKKFEYIKGIPKIIHHSWKDENVPKIFQTWQQRWKESHPTWEHHLWTDDDNRELIKKHFPFFLTTYDAFPMGVMRADSVRYLYMYLYGGLYTDLDMEPLKSTEELISRMEISTDKPTAILGYMGDDYSFEHNVPNAWMVSTPQHPFWMFCILKIIQLNTQGYNGAEVLTGPVMLFRALKEYNEAQRRISGVVAPGIEDGTTKLFDVHLLKPGLIYPIDWHRSDKTSEFCGGWLISDDINNKCRNAFPDAFTITYWTHSWE